MNKAKEIFNRIQELRRLLHAWNREYYFEQKPTVTDATYDQHYQQLVELERQYPEFHHSQSPTQKIGYWEADQLPKIAHRTRLLSLKNAFELSDLIAFDERVRKITGNQHNYLGEPKIDGLSLSLVFKNYRFSYAATRGNGRVGENVTTNVREINELQSLLSQKFPLKNFEIRGEVYLSNASFAELNAKINAEQTQTIQTLANKWESQIRELAQVHHFSWNSKSSQSVISSLSGAGLLHDDPFSVWNKKISRQKLKNQMIWKLIPVGNGNHEKWLKLITQHIKGSSYRFQEVKNCKYYELIFNFSFTQIPFLNPRNVASGSLRQLDSTITRQRNLSVSFYELITDEIKISTRAEQIKRIGEWGFPIASENQVCRNLKEIQTFITKLEECRYQMPYPTDGVVIKVNQKAFDSALGETEKIPNYAIAFKFPAKIVETRILDIFPTIGRTGRVAYNAKLQKILLDGSMIQAATLHNAEFIENLDIRIGDLVAIKKAGDIIPCVLKVNKLYRPATAQKWIRSQTCPYCQTALIQKVAEVDQYCSNLNCPERKIRELIYFVSSEAMNIFGLSEQTLRTFWKLGLVRSYVDIYKLPERKQKLLKWSQENVLSHLGPRSIDNLFTAIQKSRHRPWSQLLTALNIRYLGNRTARLVAEHFPTLSHLTKASAEHLQKIPGIGEKSAMSVYHFFQIASNRELLQELQDLGVGHARPTERRVSFSSVFFEKKVLITGTFAVPRRRLIAQLTALGAQIVTAISNRTDYLLVGNNPGSKLRAARALGIKIIDESQLQSLLTKDNLSDG